MDEEQIFPIQHLNIYIDVYLGLFTTNILSIINWDAYVSFGRYSFERGRRIYLKKPENS